MEANLCYNRVVLHGNCVAMAGIVPLSNRSGRKQWTLHGNLRPVISYIKKEIAQWRFRQGRGELFMRDAHVIYD